MLRVALLMDHPSPHMVGFLDALGRRNDCAVQVVYFRPGAPERRWGDPTGSLPYCFASKSKESIGVFNVVPVLVQVSHKRADIWVVNSCYTAPETWAAIAWLNASGLPWVYMNEPPRPRSGAWAVKLTLLRWTLRQAVGVIGMGREAKAKYLQLVGGSKAATSVPYYIDLQEFLNLPLPLPSTTVRFFTAVQMIERKGIDVLLAACQLLPKKGWTLTLAGEGPLRTELEQAFQILWGSSQVCFLGEVSYAERVKVFAGQHVFVFPSRWDGWGMAPVEAMAAGLPVIATDQVISMCEFVKEDINGYLIPSKNPVALADRMSKFIARPELIPIMGEAARAALADYKPDVGADRLVSFLRDIDSRLQSEAAHVKASTEVHLDLIPTWSSLTHAKQMSIRVHQRGRAWIKRAVIDTTLALPWRKDVPRGHRILVYHLVLKEDRKRFEEHLCYLSDHFKLVTVGDLVRDLHGSSDAPMAAITFDDGFRVLMSDALEVLARNSVKATFFVPTGFIGAASDPIQSTQYSLKAHYYQRPLTPMRVEDLVLLQALGHEIGSHGVSHLAMNAVSRGIAVDELVASRDQLFSWLGVTPRGFAYPYGDCHSSVGELPAWVADAGYSYAVTLQRGIIHCGTNRMMLPRDHVEGRWRARDLQYFMNR